MDSPTWLSAEFGRLFFVLKLRDCPTAFVRFFIGKNAPPKGNHVDKVQSKKCFSLSRSALCRQGHLLVGRQDLAADLIVVRRDGPRLIFHNLPRFYFR
jgi:hypothetical protein